MNPNAWLRSCRPSISKRRVLIGVGLGAALAIGAAATTGAEEDHPILGLEAGLLLFFLLALGLGLRLWRRNFEKTPAVSPTVRRLQRHPELLAMYHSLANSLATMVNHTDEVLCDAMMVKLAVIQEEMHTLATGKLVYAGTEAWRTAYERILRAPGLRRYCSVAWLRSEDYWRDAPGRHSMQLNYDLVQLGIRIERTLILSDFFWPEGAVLPAKVICQWIEQQYKRGIVIRLVRETQIAEESELLCDFGIYGERATGVLELDDQCRTLQFTLDFDPQSVRLFEERWRRLLLFAVSYRELLDRRAQGG